MGLDDDIAILSAAPVFEFFDSGALRLLSFAGERLPLESGESLFKRGDRADGGYVVLSGTIELTGRGGTPIVAGRAALIGRTALFTPGKRPADAVATSKAEVMRISTQLMSRVLKEFPEAAGAIYDWLADDLDALTRGLATVRARLVDPRAK
ncbi:MAG: Crp/Fnr family transcriptional regulator [Methylobacterium sp.]